MSDNVNRRKFWQYVNQKINRLVHHYHVFSVITITFEEVLKDLKQGKEIKIFNFGTLILKETKPRRYHDVRQRQVMLSKGHKILRFTLAPQIRKKLCDHLDIDSNSEDD